MIGTILALATAGKFIVDTISDNSKAGTYDARARQKALEIIELNRRKEQDVLSTKERGVAAVSKAELTLTNAGITGTSALGQLAGLQSAIEREVNNTGSKFAFETKKKETEKASLQRASSNLTGFGGFISRGVSAGLSTYGAFGAGGGEFPNTNLKTGAEKITGYVGDVNINNADVG